MDSPILSAEEAVEVKESIRETIIPVDLSVLDATEMAGMK